jgi:uroporphyrinogen decarboxylase
MREMSSRERVFTALERREPDMVPIHEVIISPNVIDGIIPGGTYFDFIEKFDIDMAGVNQSHDFTGMQVVDEEKQLFRDKWGVIRKRGKEMVLFPVEGPIKTEEDLKTFQPPDPASDGNLPVLNETVKRFKGKKAILWAGRDSFIIPTYLRGMDNLLMDFVLNPKFAAAIIEMCVEWALQVNKLAIKAGAEVVVLADDYAWRNGPFMSPEHFRQFVLPGLKRCVKSVKDNGAFCIKHTDGNLWPIMDMLVETGIDGINPLEPIADMDIGEVKAKYGDRIAVVGNIDCGYILSEATIDEVKAAVKECISKASPGGGHIISSSNSIHSSVKPENYVAMLEATREYGRYPIKV